ncbi:MAG: AmmeMemoRadiSam system protein A [Clostridium sp.]|jgi:AmmeMemoRadiSam system protein A/AmmeMemoRadiSam system protein B|nr:AmmeMemoRadiSam system protein A [Clostridium sp.]
MKGYLVPHPPLIVQGVGDGTEIPGTRAAYEQSAKEISGYAPETVVVVSPHSILYADYFHISPGNRAKGSFAQFHAPQVKFDVSYDSELAARIAETARQSGIPAGFLGERDRSLDHGTMVPLWFLRASSPALPLLVRVSLSGLPFVEQYRFGRCIRQAAASLNRRIAVIASGDLSHRLGGSYGFSPSGAEHDRFVRECIEASDLRRLFSIDPALAENAAECGLRSAMILAGVFDGLHVRSEVLHYEAPFGVGYLTAKFEGTGEAQSLLPLLLADRSARIRSRRRQEDAFVRLARETVERFVKTGHALRLPEELPAEMTGSRAGVFVSIQKNGGLRGCIGTTAPTCPNIAQEIIRNGISACSQDPRFDPVASDELDELTYSVDVLSEPEPVPDRSLLDPHRYGVIVTSGRRRGLLLPDLDGVETVDEQLEIARKKGGIRPDEPCSLERFEVVRHR